MPTGTVMTASEFEAVCQKIGSCELVHGEVVRLSPGGYLHSLVTMNAGGLLWRWARETGHGRTITAEAGLIVSSDPDTVRAADVAYYSYQRLPQGQQPEGFSKTPPTLVVEVVGRGQAWREMVEKAGEYLRMGVDRVWIIDPKSRRLHVFRPDGEPSVLSEKDPVENEHVLPGFRCLVGDFFAD